MQCPVCRTGALTPFYRREGEPAGQSFVMDTREQARGIPRGTLELACCADCEFLCNAQFDPKLTFDSSYNSVQTHSPAFDAYLRDRAAFLMSERGVRNCRIVDIGCGRGEFLRLLTEDPDAGNTGIGFDTVYDGPAEDMDGRLQFVRGYFGPGAVPEPIDVVTCRLVMEYITDPVEFLQNIRSALAGSPAVRLYVEVLDALWTLTNDAYWDVFYERFAYWTPHALAAAFREAGFRVDAVTPSFGGQYFQLEASLGAGAGIDVPRADVAALARKFAARAEEFRLRWTENIAALAAQKPVAVWGAAGKGVTFVNMVDPHGTVVTCVADINPAKRGKFVPGTGHPITGVAGLATFGIGYAVITNPNYTEEIRGQLRGAGLHAVELVPLL